MEYFQTIFQNRRKAGEHLAKKLLPYTFEKPVILTLPREGVPVAAKVAEKLEAPLDVIVSRTLFAPENRVAFGAIASGDVVVLDRSVQSSLNLSDADVTKIIDQERTEMVKDMVRYDSGSHVARHIAHHTVIIVDDGQASGLAVRAAIEAARILYNPHSIVFAAPVCSKDMVSMIKDVVDDIVCVNAPRKLFSIGNWYEDFRKVTDEEARGYINQLFNPKPLLSF
jgi:putative phosphoribosyl transferase